MGAKRHHAVPRFLLARFADATGRIWLHDLREATAIQVTPESAMAEKYLYAPEAGDDPLNDSFETFLAKNVDGPAVSPLSLLAKGEQFTAVDRERVAIFLAFQEVRVPRMRDNVTGAMSEIGQRILKLMFSHPESVRAIFTEMGEDVPDDLVARLTSAIQTGGVKVEATKEPWFWAMGMATEIAEMLFHMPWTVVEAPAGQSFITSDRPVVKVLTDRQVPAQYAGGWLSPSAESTFALDPHTCLVIRPDGQEGRTGVKAEWCADVNRRTISLAKRFVGSRDRDEYIDTKPAGGGKSDVKGDGGTTS